MDTAPIKSDSAYRRALEEIEHLMHAKRDTPEGARLDALVAAVEVWESRRLALD